MTERTISVGGPVIKEPALFTTVRGANIDQLIAGRVDTKSVKNGEVRLVAGSVLHGRTAVQPVNYLGRFHNQVSALLEGNFREFLGWQKPGLNKFSVTRAFVGSWLKGKRFKMNTNINGGHRTMVPIGTFERVMPLDILPTQLLRALITGDTEQAQLLGCLELDEEDLGLCTFVCPGKYEYGNILRENLTRIEKEG